MIVDLNWFGLGSPLMNFSSHLPAAHLDGGYRMEHVEDGSWLQWGAFPVALGGHVGVLSGLKMLWCLLRKVLGHKWLLKTLRVCWPEVADRLKNQNPHPCKDQLLFSSPMDPAESLVVTDEGMAEMLNLQGGEGGNGANMAALHQSQMLATIGGPAEEDEDESGWSSESDEEDKDSDSAIETDRASLGSAPSNTDSTWSDEEDSTDSWDLDDENRTLWDSFCNNTDPYNPLSFSNLPGSQSVARATETKVARQGFTRTSDHLSPGISAALPDPDTREPTTEETGNRQQQQSLRSSSNTKKVRFSPTVIVRQMRTWSFAHRTARRGPWEEMARDRCRFQKRVAEVEAAIGWCLELRHRETIRARKKEAVLS